MDILSTLFQWQSRKIGAIVLSVVISEKRSDTLEIIKRPVEVGVATADHAYKKPSEMIMETGSAGGGSLLDSVNNLTAAGLLGLNPRQTHQETLGLQTSCISFDVVTGKCPYGNILIRVLGVTVNKTIKNILSAVLTLREVVTSQTQQITAADKTDMKDKTSMSTVLDTGDKAAESPNTSLLQSDAALLGFG